MSSKKSHKKQKGAGRKRNYKKKNNDGGLSSQLGMKITVIPRGGNFIAIAEATILTMCYAEETTNMIGVVGNSWAGLDNWRNSGYDANSAIASTNYSGFAEWAAFYNLNLVLSTKFEFIFSNLETFPVVLHGFPSRTTGLLTSRANVISSSETAGGTKIIQLSAKGGLDTKKMIRTINWAQVNGSRTHYTGDNSFSGTFGANPATMYYFSIASYSPDGSVTVNKVTFSLKMTSRFLLYERKPQFS